MWESAENIQIKIDRFKNRQRTNSQERRACIKR